MVVKQQHRQVTNQQIAESLEEAAQLLEDQGANPFRVRAYRNAAGTVRGLKGAAERIFEAEGVEGLMQLPGIGRSLAHSIGQMVRTGRLAIVERLRGEDAPERTFMTVADIGPELARRIHEQLGIETLFELEAAALDGRLAEVPGMGRKRIRAVRESLAGRFSRRRAPQRESPSAQSPSLQQGSRPAQETTRREEPPEVPVEELLDVDEEYRRLAKQQKLPRIAPRRFNPTHEAWLPILHTERGDRHYTAMFSNTARAHELGTTGDWVVIYRDGDENGQWTVITSNFGRLRGRRVVRGRENEMKPRLER